MQSCPIARLAQHLKMQQGQLSDEEFEEMDREILRTIEASVALRQGEPVPGARRGARRRLRGLSAGEETMRTITYDQAALEAIAEEMRRDPKGFHLGTDAPPPLLEGVRAGARARRRRSPRAR